MPTTYEPIASQTVSVAASSVTFSGIPNTYTDLFLVAYWGESGAGSPYGDNGFRLNSDSGSNYSAIMLYGNGSTATSFQWLNQTSIRVAQNATDYPMAVIHVPNYASTSMFKTVLSGFGTEDNVGRSVGLWRNAAAVTSVTFVNLGTNISVGSTFALYGVKAA